MVARLRWARLALLLVGSLASGRAEAGFTIRDLGVLTKDGTSGARAINASGQSAGSATRDDGSTVAVLSGGGAFAALVPPNSTYSTATGIDSSGNVAGTMVDAADHQMHAFSYSGGSFQEYGPLQVAGRMGGATQATAISGGEVVGYGSIPGRVVNGVYTAYSSPAQAAFRASSPGSVTLIAPLGTGQANTANGLNNLGTVVGGSETTPGGTVHPYLATRDGVVSDLLSTRNGAGNFTLSSEGFAINDRDDVVGSGLVGNRMHAFFASRVAGSNLVDLGLLGGTASYAYGVNSLANPLVVGKVDYGPSISHAFLWESSLGMVDLRTLLSTSDQSRWTQLSQATAINDANQIVGTGIFNGQEHAFLLTPVPGRPIFEQATAVPAPPASVLVAIGCTLTAMTCFRRSSSRP